jgi:hypothetical protein
MFSRESIGTTYPSEIEVSLQCPNVEKQPEPLHHGKEPSSVATVVNSVERDAFAAAPTSHARIAK